ncbi:hypothetical protein VNO77_02015 [Canavalia gladiata]|uniref:Uncharacterized protein n=1 Tax=Canavalia gladiata TaxID=3824 RepID=A0AAN9MX38_CANGL
MDFESKVFAPPDTFGGTHLLKSGEANNLLEFCFVYDVLCALLKLVVFRGQQSSVIPLPKKAVYTIQFLRMGY